VNHAGNNTTRTERVRKNIRTWTSDQKRVAKKARVKRDRRRWREEVTRNDGMSAPKKRRKAT
jgi:hypothetical protein